MKERSKEAPDQDVVLNAHVAIVLSHTGFNGNWTGGHMSDITARYNAQKIISEFKRLKSRLEGIDLQISNINAIDYLRQKHGPEDCLYLDPPYYKAGKSLYTTNMSIQEHHELARILKEKQRWVLSYDACCAIDELYDWAVRIPIQVEYSTKDRRRKNAVKTEYIILPPGTKRLENVQITMDEYEG